MVPAVARSSPESTLRNVDFPAPLGPMTACTRPRSKASETPSTAASAPKRRDRSCVWRMVSPIAAQQSRHAAGEEEHDGNHHRADDGDPVIGEPLAVMLQESEQKCAQDGSVKSSLPAQQNCHEHQ